MVMSHSEAWGVRNYGEIDKYFSGFLKMLLRDKHNTSMMLIPADQRLCEECNLVEDECHVIMYCTLYTDHIRDQLFTEISEISYHYSHINSR